MPPLVTVDPPHGLEIITPQPVNMIDGSYDTSPDAQWAGINNRMGRFPTDIQKFDFTQPEEPLRKLLFGRGDWALPHVVPPLYTSEF